MIIGIVRYNGMSQYGNDGTYNPIIVDDGLKPVGNSDHATRFEFFPNGDLDLSVCLEIDTR
jgi:hypothetical protein